MALGGGTFGTQNKKLPGAYINFVSAVTASASLSDRGIVTMPLELNWGEDGKVFTVTKDDFITDSMKIFGYEYDAPEMKGLRDLFRNADKLYAYKLTTGGVKATNTYATAKCCGTRGNDLKVVITKNVDDVSKFDVDLYMGTVKLNSQTVKTAGELVDDAWVTYNTSAELEETAGTALSTGTNGVVSGDSHKAYLNLIESYSFNTMGVVTTDGSTLSLYTAFVKRLRDSIGSKFQLVVSGKAADYEGVINVKNGADLVWWVTGAEAGCAVNSSCTNKLYDGEFTVNANYTQAQLEDCIDAGELVFHRVGDDVRVLTDINSLVTVTDDKSEAFKSNQTIRVIDQLGNDIAVLFNTKYVGQIPNDADGRTSLWSDVVKLHQELADIRAIEDFKEEDVVVTAGATKKAVVISDVVTIVNAMEQLYMTVTVQ